MKKILMFGLVVVMCIMTVLGNSTVAYASESENEGQIFVDVLSQLGISVDDNSSESNAGGEVVIVGGDENIEGAYEVYSAFVKQCADVMGDDSWDGCLSNYDLLTRSAYIKSYIKNIKDATEADWNKKSAFEVFVYSECYLRFADLVGSATYKNYIQNGSAGVERLIKNATGLWTGNDADKVKESYRALVEWQVEFMRSYGYPYNFIEGSTYADETKLEIPVSGEKQSESEEMKKDSDFSEEELKEIKDIVNEVKTEEKVEEEVGLWEDVLRLLKENILTIGLLAGLFVAWLVVRAIIKKRSIDEMTSDGK